MYSDDELFSPETGPQKHFLRPDHSHFHARVVSVTQQLRGKLKPTGRKIVGMDYWDDDGDLDTKYTTTPMSSVLSRKLRVNDTVLFKVYEDLDEAYKDGHEDLNPIVSLYSKEEEAELKSQGVFFPDCPPEYLPDGYYG